MVNNTKQNTRQKPARQWVRDVIPEPNKIGASTPYNFEGRNLTAYGGLLPVPTMLEKLRFRELVEAKGIFQRRMDRLRAIGGAGSGFTPVVATPLRC